jgi:hypothetical protein
MNKLLGSFSYTIEGCNFFYTLYIYNVLISKESFILFNKRKKVNINIVYGNTADLTGVQSLFLMC